MTRQARKMNEQVTRARFVVRLSELRRLAVAVHGHRFRGREAKPRHLEIPHTIALEMLTALHAQHERGELLPRHRAHDAGIQQTVTNARSRRDQRAASSRARIADREQKELGVESKPGCLEQCPPWFESCKLPKSRDEIRD